MAVVYLAHHVDLQSPVALKELSGVYANDASSTTRFLREAQLTASLNHPNIVRVHDYFEHDGLPYIAMEVLPRGSLRPCVGALSLAQTLGVLDAILAGLSHAHEKGIVHRDLKPENLMRADDGTIKIADFGIALALAQDGVAVSHLTPHGTLHGSPAYVSPEQVRGAEATSASDLYSVGVIAFELLTGDVPFAGSAPTEFLIRKVTEHPPSVRARRPDLDRGLAAWVDHLLDRDPAKRPADPTAVRASLEKIAEVALGTLWRTESLLSEEMPARRTVPSPSAAHRFASLAALRTRGSLRGRVRHSISRPATIAVFGGLVVAAVLVDWRLLVVAATAYVALVAITFFDEAEPVRKASSAVGRGAE